MRVLASTSGKNQWFMAINSGGLTAEAMATLSPRVMRWAEDTWLVDVGYCLSYWKNFGRASAWSLEEFWIKLLQHIAPESIGWRCVLAPHPWLAVLAVAAMRKRNLTGFFNVREPFARSLLLTPEWSVWFETALALEPHFITTQAKGFNAAQFRQQIQALRRATDRLGISSLVALKQIQISSMHRRFGRWLALIWEWQNSCEQTAKLEPSAISSSIRSPVSRIFEQGKTKVKQPLLFESEQDSSLTSLFDESFPWCSWTWASSAQVQRHLDYSILDWEQMEPLLQTDFLRLTKHSAYHVGHHVVGLEWRIVRHDMSSLVIPISFRHPYNPLSEAPHFRTALLQTYYRFCEQRRLLQQESDEIYQRPIVSWTLTITETLRFPDAFKLLFEQHQSDLAALVRLENLLPMPLQQYQLQPEFVPECSFGLVTAEQDLLASQQIWHKAALRSLQAVAGRRPLFLYERPISLNHNAKYSRAWRYGERCSEPWWQIPEQLPKNQPASDLVKSSTEDLKQGGNVSLSAAPTQRFSHERDYYRMVESNGEQYWVYRRSCGQWFTHGIFA